MVAECSKSSDIRDSSMFHFTGQVQFFVQSESGYLLMLVKFLVCKMDAGVFLLSSLGRFAGSAAHFMHSCSHDLFCASAIPVGVHGDNARFPLCFSSFASLLCNLFNGGCKDAQQFIVHDFKHHVLFLFRCSAHPAGPVVSEVASVLACAWLCWFC